jgi:hypothetical protein
MKKLITQCMHAVTLRLEKSWGAPATFVCFSITLLCLFLGLGMWVAFFIALVITTGAMGMWWCHQFHQMIRVRTNEAKRINEQILGCTAAEKKNVIVKLTSLQAQGGCDPWISLFLESISRNVSHSDFKCVEKAISEVRGEIHRDKQNTHTTFVLSAMLIGGVALTIFSMQNSMPKLVDALNSLTGSQSDEEFTLYTKHSTAFFNEIKAAYLPSFWAVCTTVVLLFQRSKSPRHEHEFLKELEKIGREIVLQIISERPVSPAENLSGSLHQVAGNVAQASREIMSAKMAVIQQSTSLQRSLEETAGTVAPAIESAALEAAELMSRFEMARINVERSLLWAAGKAEDFAASSVKIGHASLAALETGNWALSEVAKTNAQTQDVVAKQTDTIVKADENIREALSVTARTVEERASHFGDRLVAFENLFKGFFEEHIRSQKSLDDRLGMLEANLHTLGALLNGSIESSKALQINVLDAARGLTEVYQQSSHTSAVLISSGRALEGSVGTLNKIISENLPGMTAAMNENTMTGTKAATVAKESLDEARMVLSAAHNAIQSLQGVTNRLDARLTAVTTTLGETNTTLNAAVPAITSILEDSRKAASHVESAGREISSAISTLPVAAQNAAIVITDNANATLDSFHDKLLNSMDEGLAKLDAGIRQTLRPSRTNKRSGKAQGEIGKPAEGETNADKSEQGIGLLDRIWGWFWRQNR